MQLPNLQELARRMDESWKVLDPRQQMYLVTYPAMVAHFRTPHPLTRDQVLAGLVMVYGWMPTIPGFKMDSEAVDEVIQRAVSALNRARKGPALKESELGDVWQLTNRSWVGASKLLHFVNPDVYPIWDSKLCKSLLGSATRVQKYKNYRAYQDACLDAVGASGFAVLHSRVQERLGYEVSPLRAIELALFMAASQS